jgi:hypothetical protein
LNDTSHKSVKCSAHRVDELVGAGTNVISHYKEFKISAVVLFNSVVFEFLVVVFLELYEVNRSFKLCLLAIACHCAI